MPSHTRLLLPEPNSLPAALGAVAAVTTVTIVTIVMLVNSVCWHGSEHHACRNTPLTREGWGGVIQTASNARRQCTACSAIHRVLFGLSAGPYYEQGSESRTKHSSRVGGATGAGAASSQQQRLTNNPECGQHKPQQPCPHQSALLCHQCRPTQVLKRRETAASRSCQPAVAAGCVVRPAQHCCGQQGLGHHCRSHQGTQSSRA